MAKIGVFGGTFDPVHVGHLIAAEEVRWSLGLDKVLFVPAADPPHKRGVSMADAADRVTMLELALDHNPGFAVDRTDVDRPGPHFTVDLLARLAAQLGESCELFFILGADSLQDLPNWRRPEDIVRLARIVVVDRPGYGLLPPAVAGLAANLLHVPVPLVGVSSSDIEARVRAGRPIRYQVPEAVGDYIQLHRLYSEQGRGSS